MGIKLAAAGLICLGLGMLGVTFPYFVIITAILLIVGGAGILFGF